MVDVYDKDLTTVNKVGKVYPASVNGGGAPSGSNDQAHGYHIGDMWITSANVIYMLAIDTPAGSAVWKQISD
jgi:hypothetical protein